jgi:hypothetical protein
VGISKDAGPSVASWFETRFALLTMRSYFAEIASRSLASAASTTSRVYGF